MASFWWGPSSRWETADMFQCPHMVERAREGCGISFIRAGIPFMRVAPSWPNHLPKAPLPKIITLGIRISTKEFGGVTNIRTIATRNRNKFLVSLRVPMKKTTVHSKIMMILDVSPWGEGQDKDVHYTTYIQYCAGGCMLCKKARKVRLVEIRKVNTHYLKIVYTENPKESINKWFWF